MKALGFSLACLARSCSPPASESAFRIIARKSALSLLGVPATRPPVLRPLAILLPSTWPFYTFRPVDACAPRLPVCPEHDGGAERLHIVSHRRCRSGCVFAGGRRLCVIAGPTAINAVLA